MVYVYLCQNCKEGNHSYCEVNKDIPEGRTEDEMICGGGHCVCPHDKIYSSMDEVWNNK